MGRNARKERCGAIWSESGTSVHDLRKRATVSSNPTLAAGPNGRPVFSFDGTDDKAAYSNQYLSVKTWEGWAYLTTTTEELVDFDGGTHYIKATAGTLAATGWTAPTIYVDGVATTTIAAAGWHHVAVTTGTAFDATSLQLATDNTGFGAVRLGDMSMWPRALSADEISAIHARTVWDYTKTLQAHWGCSAINDPDLGWPGNGYDMTGVSLAAANIVDGPYGGKAVDLDGAADCYTRTETDWRSGDSSGSIVVVAKADTLAASQTLLGTADYASAVKYLHIWLDSTQRLNVQQTNDDTVDRVRGGTTLAANTWYTFGFCSSGSAYRAYVDGVAETMSVVTGSDTGDWLAETPDRDRLSIGALVYNSTAGLYFNGKIAGVYYFNTELLPIQHMDFHTSLMRGIA